MIQRLVFAFAMLAFARLVAAAPSPEAAQLYRDGQTAYDQAHYDDALASWHRSYELSQAPGLLFNIAQAYRLRAHHGDCAEARTQYQRFIELTSPSPQRALAEEYVGSLASCARDALVGPAAPVVRDAAPTRDDTIRNRQIAVAALGAGGFVMLVTGVYFNHHASVLGDEVTSACTIAHPCDWSVYGGKDAAGHHDTTLGWTFDTLGLLTLAGGAALYWLGIHETEPHVAMTQSRDGGAVLSWSGRW